MEQLNERESNAGYSLINKNWYRRCENMIKTGECVACKSNAEINGNYEEMSSFYTCPVCGRYELYALDNFMQKVENQLASYLLYHRFGKIGMIEYRYNTSLDKKPVINIIKNLTQGRIHMIVRYIWMLCQKDARLHFDIAQKNTIMWDTEESIPLMLKNRIVATID